MSFLGSTVGTISAISTAAQTSSNTLNNLTNSILGNPTFPNTRLGYNFPNQKAQTMSFRLPNNSVVSMYINPQNLTISDSKQIQSVRTKGGFLIQYWGANLTELRISGNTGSSGIKGIQVLKDIYNSENQGFDAIVASQQAELKQLLGSSLSLSSQGSNATQVLSDYQAQLRKRNYLLRPSLGALAASVVIFYQGVQYTGFFTSFSVTEDVNTLGLFQYDISFSATAVAGRRQNFMAWHKEPLADDFTGSLLNSAQNAILGALGVGQAPAYTFDPSNAPLTFGGSTIDSVLGIQQGQNPIGQGVFSSI